RRGRREARGSRQQERHEAARPPDRGPRPTQGPGRDPDRPGDDDLSPPPGDRANGDGGRRAGQLMTVTPGTSLGRYDVLAPVGAGGMGEVWKARDSRLSRLVAIKVLPAELAGDSARIKRFEKEARAICALNHPNVVTLYEVGREGEMSYIAMELVEGRTLRELLFGGALPVKKLLPIATQIADGLARAHEAGIVHRDLKP